MNRLKRYFVAPLLALGLLLGVMGVAHADTWWGTVSGPTGPDGYCVKSKAMTVNVDNGSLDYVNLTFGTSLNNGTGCGTWVNPLDNQIRARHSLWHSSDYGATWQGCDQPQGWGYIDNGTSNTLDQTTSIGQASNWRSRCNTSGGVGHRIKVMVESQAFIYLQWVGGASYSSLWTLPASGDGVEL